MLCPSNQPFEGARSARIKFVQKVAPTVSQYRCKHCGCLVNVSVEVAENKTAQAIYKTPSLMGWKQ